MTHHVLTLPQWAGLRTFSSPRSASTPLDLKSTRKAVSLGIALRYLAQPRAPLHTPPSVKAPTSTTR